MLEQFGVRKDHATIQQLVKVANSLVGRRNATLHSGTVVLT